ncbi:MAG: peptidase M11 [Gammaproteobacteria bacterium]|nr:peptidase M11 [Gammaproteobacteria bacterium]MCW5583749.1 peptidase M11 [Gammaproteobacteria bacterium]
MKSLFNLRKHLFHLLIFFILSSFSLIGWSSEIAPLKKLTEELITFSRLFSSGQEVSGTARDKAIHTAQLRREALMKSLNNPPNNLASVLLTKNVADAFPKDFAPYIEKEITDIEGNLEIRAALYLDGKGEAIQYVLQTKDGKLYYLYFLGHAGSTLKTGMIVKLRKAVSFSMPNGYDRLLVSDENLVVLKKETTALPGTLGPQKTIAILVNFQNQPTNKPWTREAVGDLVFNTVNNQYFELSYNQTTIVGNAIGWYTIPLNSNIDCDTLTNNIPILAENAAAQAGIDLSPYPRRIFLFPTTSSCFWAGLGTIGSPTYSRSWINGYNDLRVVGHELGHNLGIWHSRFLRCPGSSTEGNCTLTEYGDYTDTMGSGWGTHFNAYQKERLGWLNYGSSPTIQTVTSSGDFTIFPYETRGTTPANNIKGLKILKKTNPNGSQDYYYLEFRQPIGFDVSLGSCGTSCDFTRGVLVHQGNSINGNSSDLLDMSPLTPSLSMVTLLPGQTFKDPNAPNGGVTITTNSINASSAKVSVKFGNTPPPVCVRATHTMQITPDTIQVVHPGGVVSYIVTVKNNDSSACTPSQFSFSVAKSSNSIVGLLNTNNITLSPGSQAMLELRIWTAFASPAVYYFGVIGENLSVPGPQAVVVGGINVRN